MKENETTQESNGFTKTLEESKRTLFYAVHKMKNEIGVLTKTSDNPFFKSKYLELSDLLSALQPLFEKWQLLLLQPTEDNKVFTRIIFIETGEYIESYLDIPPNNNPQQLGSSITYFRRYTLESLLGLRAEDDDGNKVKPNTSPKQPPKSAKKNITPKRFKECKQAISESKTTLADIKKNYILSQEQEQELKAIK